MAGFEDDGVEGEELARIRSVDEGGGDIRELGGLFAGVQDVEDHAEGVDIGGDCTGGFTGRGHETRGADISSDLVDRADFGDEAHVRELGLAIHEDDVLGFDIPMGEAVPMDEFQGVGEGEADTRAFSHGKTALFGTLLGENITRFVGGGSLFPMQRGGITEFHDVVIMVGLFFAKKIHT